MEQTEETIHHLLISGYIHEFESQNEHILIPREILVVILIFYPTYKMLKFDQHMYKSKIVTISDDQKCATKSEEGQCWILSGGDAIKKGIAVWRIKVECIRQI